MMKILGLDVGTKRIGVAKADTSVRIAVPICTITVDGTELQQIARLARVQGISFFVIGLPRSNSGTETEQSRYSRDFADKLKKSIPGARIAFQDESLTSVLAEERLRSSKKSYAKGDIDAEAASIILQDFIENVKNGSLESADFKSTGVMPATQKKKSMNKNLKTGLIIGLSTLVLLAASAITFYSISLGPVDSSCVPADAETLLPEDDKCNSKQVVITSGTSTADIASTLKNRLLIKNDFIFKLYLKLTGKSGNLKAGTYTISTDMSVPQIVALLSDSAAGVVSARLTTFPGGTLAAFKRTLLDAGFTNDQIDEAFDETYMSSIMSDKPAGTSLEGYIFPETIEYTTDQSVSDIINSLLAEYEDAFLTYSLESRFASHGLSVYEGITLASVVQKEANTPEDMALVASVFYNRLALGMPLGADAPVQYALNLEDPDRTLYPDGVSQLNIDSCYNTRKNVGLPCGPIASPGISALRAVAMPSDTSYLFFLTGDDGLMYYGTTEAEHYDNIRIHCQKNCGGSL